MSWNSTGNQPLHSPSLRTNFWPCRSIRATGSSGSTSTVNGSVAGRRVFQKSIVGSDQIGRHPIVLHFNLHDFSALNRPHCRGRIVGIKSERAIGAAQVGRAHAGKSLSLGIDRRKIRRNAIDVIAARRSRPKFPRKPCRAAAVRPTRCPAESPTSDLKTVLRPFDLRRRKIKLKILRVAMDEIEDPMAAGIHSRNQVRPGHRALRRNAGRQAAERSLAAASRAKFGILPSAMNLVSRSGSRPSTPRIIIFSLREPAAPCTRWQERRAEDAAAHKASRHTNRTEFSEGHNHSNRSSFTEVASSRHRLES